MSHHVADSGSEGALGYQPWGRRAGWKLPSFHPLNPDLLTWGTGIIKVRPVDSPCASPVSWWALYKGKQSLLSTQKEGMCGHGQVWGTWPPLALTLLLSCLWQVHNVAFAFELMLDGGLKKPKARPEGETPPE